MIEKNSEIHLSMEELQVLKDYSNNSLSKKAETGNLPVELNRFEGWVTLEDLLEETKND